MPVGRKRQSNFNLPPRMHIKAGVYYHVSSTTPRKWTKLHAELPKARTLWAQIENMEFDSPSVTFNDRLAIYLASDKFARLADKTRKQYEHVAKTLTEYFAGARLDAITPAHIAIWMDNHRSPIQANTGKAIISNVFDVAVRHGIINANPAKQIKYNTIDKRDRLITDQEYRAIWNQADDHVRIAMDIGYLTGARIQDILDIKLGDIGEDGVFIKTGKTKKRMLFMWSEALHEVIGRAKALPRSVRGMNLICDRCGSPYPYGTFNQHWLKAVRAVGVQEVHFHDIRAKAATDAKALGMDYQLLLGHASKAMSDRYIRQREIAKVPTLKTSVAGKL